MKGRGDQNGRVAIIGMACRYPGARDPAEFHELAVAGRRLFQPVAGLPGRPLHAALLDDWTVPPVSFGDPELGPQDLGPVQKLAGEMTALALADAGLRDAAGATRTGLIIASVTPGVCDLVREEFGFGASGPYRPTAYLSSLHAVAAAADALQSGALDLAVAGGAELGIDPVWLALQARAGTLGTDVMRVFAADPVGLLPGEGCAMVVLARAADARAAGVPVYAEIAGWSTTPAMNPKLAARTSLQAYRQAGIDPAQIGFIEGQGTGTAAGDSAELAALAQLRRGGRNVAALGAVSASIGYTKAAAGIASLVKTALAMAAGTIPPSTGCGRPHPLIESGETLLRLPPQPESWPDGPRLAAVNSLGTADPAAMPGLSGSQDAEGMHLILRREDEAHRGAGRRRRAAETTTAQPDSPGLAAGPGQAPLGKHMTPARPTARSPQGANAAGQGTTGPGQGATAAGPAQAGPGAARAGSGTAQTQAGPAQAGPGAAQTLADARDRANVFAFCGGEAGALAHRLDVIAASATELSDAEVHELARQLAIGARGASEETSPLRIALTAATPGRLAAQAQYAARLLRTGGPVTPAEPGVHISAGATGRVMVVFPGRAESAAAHTALLSVSLEALAALDVLGVKPVIGVGYGLGEIAGLVWAGSLPAAEAARLIAQCGRVLKACACGPAAMARITGNAEVTRALCAPDRLNIAVYEGPGAHVLTGSTAGIRELARRAGALGLPVEILDATSDMHSPAMAGCVAPLRDVFAGTRAAAPQRRLISTITGQLLTAADDIAELLARQVSLPVLFAQALTQAAQEADLVVIAGPDASLAATTAACCALPAVAIPAPTPAGFTDAASAQAVAALFAAGAITDVGPFLATSRSADTLASRTVPRMRTAEPPARHAPRTVPDPEGQEDDAADRRTAVRSGN